MTVNQTVVKGQYLWDEGVIDNFRHDGQTEKARDMRLHNIQYLLEEILKELKEGEK